MKTLVITDVQRDFYHPEGSLYVPGGELLPAKIMAIADNYDKVVFSLDWHPGDHCSFKENGGIWPAHCVAFTQGAGLADEFAALLVKGSDTVYDKVSFYFKGKNPQEEQYGAFPEGPVDFPWMEESDEIHICGIAGDYCVKETARNIINFGYADKLTVLLDCTVSIDGGETLDAFIKEYKLKTA